MLRQDEIDRILVFFYRSNHAHDFINYVRPVCWLDNLPMAGLEELALLFSRLNQDVLDEIDKRKADGMPRYSREWHASQAAPQ